MNEVLQALDYLKREKRRHWIDGDKSTECLDIIEKELKDKEELAQALSIVTCENGDLLKYKKALKIIITKRLNVDEIYHKDYKWYLLDHKNEDSELIPTKEEYDLLKEVLLS